MAAKMRDATEEFKPFERKANTAGGHPRPRKGATAKKRARREERRAAPAPAPAPTKKGGKR